MYKLAEPVGRVFEEEEFEEMDVGHKGRAPAIVVPPKVVLRPPHPYA